MQDLTQELETIARLLQEQEHVDATADRIVETAVKWTGGDTLSGITMVRRRRRVETIGASDDLVTRGDALQYEIGEGPCLDALWEERQISVSDLANEPRWPRWGPKVCEELGVRSMLCTRLFTNADTLGALNIYSRMEDAFDEAIRDDITALAAHAAVAVAASQQIASLTVAVDRRTTIGVAIGILMTRYHLDQSKAFATLQRISSDRNIKIYDLSEQIVATGQAPTAGREEQ